MELACYALAALSTLAAIDSFYYHTWKVGLHRRPECRSELLWHGARSVAMALQFALLPNVQLSGSAVLLVYGLLLADLVTDVGDVLVERKSRHQLGWLPTGEYLLHVLISVTWGVYALLLVMAVTPAIGGATGLALVPPAIPWWLRAYLNLGVLVAAALGALDFLAAIRLGRRPGAVAMARVVRQS